MSAEQRIAELESLRNAQARQLGVMAQERDAAHKRIAELEAQVAALVEALRVRTGGDCGHCGHAFGGPAQCQCCVEHDALLRDLSSFAAARDARIRREALEKAVRAIRAAVQANAYVGGSDDLIAEIRALADASNTSKEEP